MVLRCILKFNLVHVNFPNRYGEQSPTYDNVIAVVDDKDEVVMN